MRTKLDSQNIDNLIENDVSFENYIDYKQGHFGNYKDEFGDIYSFLNKKNPQFVEEPNPVMKSFLDSNNENMKKIKSSSTGKQLESYIASKKMMYMYEDILDKTIDKVQEKNSEFNNSDDKEGLLKDFLEQNKTRFSMMINQQAKDVQEQVQDDISCLSVLGCGKDLSEHDTESIDNEKVLQFLQLMKRNDMIKKIIEMAGKFINTAKHEVSHRTTGNEEIIGIEFGNDLSRVLPSELAMMCNPDLKKLFLMKYVKGELQQYEKESDECKTLGDIVVVLDESGSMNIDDNIVKAKSLLFGLYEMCKSDDRNLNVIRFGGRDQIIIHKNVTMEIIIDIISEFKSYGSTSFETPIEIALEMVGKESDIIFITDGYAPISDELKESIVNAKENIELKFITMIFGYYDNPELKDISSSYNTTWSLFTKNAIR